MLKASLRVVSFLCVDLTSILATPEAAWPDVLVIDDFSSGLGKWENRGTGSLDQGQTVEVALLEEKITVLVNYCGKPLESDGVMSSERVAVRLAPTSTQVEKISKL